LTTVGHDVEEFKCIIERYGLWRPSVQEFVDTANDVKKSKKEARDEAEETEDEGEEE
jgi:hypothetical protein